MPCFPQLETQALVQFPFHKRLHTRCVVNELVDGGRITRFEGGAGSVSWHLRYTGLTEGERTALELFFQSVEGRLQPFTWLDPVCNLLAASEDFQDLPWTRDPLLIPTAGRIDPFGTTRATRIVNAAPAEQSLEQAIAAPASYRYCFSLWARSDSEAQITLSAKTESHVESTVHTVSGAWSRLAFPVKLDAPEQFITFAAGVNPTGIVDLFGAQVLGQPAPGAYLRTTMRGGVFPDSRFDQDVLLIEADSHESYSASIRIVSPYQG
jgi:hypothetical protein